MNRLLWLAAGLIVGALGFWLIKTERRAAGTPAMLAQIQQLNQLATVNYTVQKVVGLTEEKSPVGAESILIVIQAKVQAGVDLASLQPRDVTTRADRGHCHTFAGCENPERRHRREGNQSVGSPHHMVDALGSVQSGPGEESASRGPGGRRKSGSRSGHPHTSREERGDIHSRPAEPGGRQNRRHRSGQRLINRLALLGFSVSKFEREDVDLAAGVARDDPVVVDERAAPWRRHRR